jgi:hypothetical protein
MSPPEVWGPAVWTLFHTLVEKLNPNAYNKIAGSFFAMIVQICRVLPCPECSRDASGFLAKINLNNYKTKDEFKNMIYLFHNWVNAKKRKPLYNYAYLQKYAHMNLGFVINDFISKYNTKGNMKLLAETFQRSFVIRNFKAWINGFGRAFVPINIPPTIVTINQEQTQQVQETPVIEEVHVEENVVVEVPVIEEVHVEENVIQETPVAQEETNEEPVIQETPVIEEPIVQETPVIEEPIVEETPVIEESIMQETPIIEESIMQETPVIEEPVVEEPVIVEETPVIEETPVVEEPVVVQENSVQEE